MRTIILTPLALVLIGTPASAAGFPWQRYARQSDDWYRGSDARRALDNVLSHQTALGDWPKNLDTSAQPYAGDPAQLKGTFDNGATVGEIRFLARAYRVTQEAKYRDAALKGIDHVLKAQYPNGGRPGHTSSSHSVGPSRSASSACS